MNENNLNNEEKKYSKLIEDLKSLKKVAAPPGFEADLFRRINREKFKVKESFLDKIFGSFGWSFAGAAVTVATLVFITVNLNKTDTEQNPFAETPEVNNEIIEFNDSDIVEDSLSDEILNKIQKEKKEKREDSKKIEDAFIEAPSFPSTLIDKNAQDQSLPTFRVTTKTEEEEKTIDSLRKNLFQKIDSLKKE